VSPLTKKDLLFTFDYELYLGKRSGSVENCMILPTEKVRRILEDYGMQGIFFVDCTFLSILKNRKEYFPRLASDFEKIRKQLCRLIEAGHYVYPHIHPHWLDAKYLEEKHFWNLSDTRKYRFHSLTASEKEEVFNESLYTLSSLIGNQYPGFKIDAFRAGGWCIQPFEDFLPFFETHQLLADFSVLSAAKKDTNALSFDFTTVAADAKPYLFHQDPCKPEKDGPFREFPISALEAKKSGKIDFLINALLYRIKYGQGMGDGNGVAVKDKQVNAEVSQTEMASIELMRWNNKKIYRDYINKHSYMHFVSHPKMLSAHNLDMFKSFTKYIHKNFTINSNWKEITIH